MESANCHHHHTEEGNKVRKSPSLMRRTRSREAPKPVKEILRQRRTQSAEGPFQQNYCPFYMLRMKLSAPLKLSWHPSNLTSPFIYISECAFVLTMEVRWYWIGHMSTNHVWVVRRSKKCDRNVSKYPLNWSSNADVEFKLITVITSTFSFPSRDHVILPSVDWKLVKYRRTIPFDVGG